MFSPLENQTDANEMAVAVITQIWGKLQKENEESIETFKLKVLPRRNNTHVAKPLDRIEELPDEDVRTQ